MALDLPIGQLMSSKASGRFIFRLQSSVSIVIAPSIRARDSIAGRVLLLELLEGSRHTIFSAPTFSAWSLHIISFMVDAIRENSFDETPVNFAESRAVVLGTYYLWYLPVVLSLQ